MTRNANTNETIRANLASGLFARLAGAAGIVALVALFSSCLLEPDRGRSSAGDGSPGYVSMNLSLERNQRVLGKAAVAGDTTFSLDSLIIVLTANGSDTVVDRFAITGRADTGAIVLASRNYTLAGLRTWKAKFYSIDTTVSPATRDTVHIDSVTFVVRPSQTTSVTKTISAAYAILRARFVSQLRDSLGAGIRYVRIRVHGVTQDSIALTGDKFNAVWFSSVDSGWAVMDTGRVMRSIDSGKTWYPQASGTTAHLRSVSFAGGIGWIAGDGGVVRKTTNSGVNWSSVSIGYTRNLRRIYFINANTGYLVGDSGLVLKTVNSGTDWTPLYGGWYGLTSGFGSTNINDIAVSSDTVYAVGAGGTIRRATGFGITWSALASSTTATLAAVSYGSGSAVYAAGTGGAIVKYTGTTTWSALTTNTTANLNDIHFRNATNGWAVGASETAIRSTNGTAWSKGLPSGWISRTSGTANALNGVHFPNKDTGWAVGASGTLLKSVTSGRNWTAGSSGTTNALNAVTGPNGTAAVSVGDAETITRTSNGSSWSTVDSWLSATSGTTDSLKAVSFGAATNGIAVGQNGRVVRTTNSGGSWTASTSGSSTMNGVFMRDANNAIAVGAGNSTTNTRYTTDGGASWTTTNSTTANELRAVWSNAGGTLNYSVGASGTIRSATTMSTTWTSHTSNTTSRLNAVFSNGTRVWAVGDAGVIRRIPNTTTVSWSTITSGTTAQLNGVYFTSANIGYVVGNGGVIRKCTAATNDNWANQTVPAGFTEDLMSVAFRGTGTATDTGYVVGANGSILKTTNAGTNWYKLTSGTTQAINGVYLRPAATDTAYAVGANGFIAKTTNGGTWTKKGSIVSLRDVHFYTGAAGFAVGDSGVITRSLDSGKTWTALPSGVTSRLNSVFSNGTNAWAVGDAGIIRRITTIGTTATWSTVTGTTSTQLNGVYFTSSSVGYVVGNGGLIRRCTNAANTNWATQTTPTTENLLSVWFKGDGSSSGANDTGYVTGANGTILKTVNGGGTWTAHVSNTTQSLNGVVPLPSGTDSAVAVGAGGVIQTITKISGKGAPVTFQGVHFPSLDIGFLVGDSGTIAKTIDSGKTWAAQVSGVTTRLYSVYFSSTTNGWAVGDGGVILKTTDGSTWSPQTSGTSENLKRVRFVDGNNGWVTGSNGTILRTANGGTNWTAQTSGVTDTLESVFPVNADTAYVTGQNGKVLKTISQGTLRFSQTNALNSIFARNDSVYMVGNGSAAYRSRNGGLTWDTLTGISQNLNSVFSTGNNAYMVGQNGVAYYINHLVATKAVTAMSMPPSFTTNLLSVWGSPTIGSNKLFATGDSGTLLLFVAPLTNSWISLSGNLAQSFRGVHCAGGSADCWTVGDDETVLRTTNGTDWYQQTRGAKLFDKLLTYKRMRAGTADTVLMQAMDRDSPLRGYEKQVILNIPAGKDTTLNNVGLTRCGYSGPACTP